MVPIVSVVGKSNSGKTTLIEKLVRELVKKGYSVATVKHDVHGFEIDREGKDSWRHKKAGARQTIISSPEKLALISDVDGDLSLLEIGERFVGDDIDILIGEGFKRGVQPKIEVFRREVHSELLCGRRDNLVAIVSDKHFDMGVPCLGLEDIGGLADILEEKFIRVRRRERLSLRLDGKEVSLKPHIEKLLIGVIKGAVCCLKGCENYKDVRIHVEAPE